MILQVWLFVEKEQKNTIEETSVSTQKKICTE